MLVIEGLVILGIIYGVYRVITAWIRERAETRRRRDAQQHELAKAKNAEDVVSVLVVDRELASDVHRRLGNELSKAEEETPAEASEDQAARQKN